MSRIFVGFVQLNYIRMILGEYRLASQVRGELTNFRIISISFLKLSGFLTLFLAIALIARGSLVIL